MEDKVFLVFGIIGVICGIILIFQQQYLIGTGGTIASASVVFRNVKKLKTKK